MRGSDGLIGRRGASLSLVAVSMVALLASMALAIDLGILFKTRGEAQRAADAAALAGASAFITYDFTHQDAVPTAEARAMALAVSNHMTGGPIQPEEVTIQVIPDSQKVRVWVRRGEVATWFANFFGVFSKPIGAVAAAEATEAGTSKCVKPFLIPDYWHDVLPPAGEDANANRYWDLPTEPPQGQFACGQGGVECWEYDPASGDVYEQYDPSAPSGTATGLGSSWRHGSYTPGGARYDLDRGLPMMLYPNSPMNSPTPSNFYLWRIECPGGACVRDALSGCVDSAVSVGDMIAAEQPGGVVGPVAQGFDDWMNEDVTARWEQVIDYDAQGNPFWRGEVVSDNPQMNGEANPRVFVAGLISPNYLAPGYDEVPIINMGLFFLESAPTQPGSKVPAVVRFMGFASGLSGPTTGTLVKTLKLVE
jgi:hypothetical protein